MKWTFFSKRKSRTDTDTPRAANKDENLMKILITGASSGFGKLTTLSLLKAGHAVAAGVRDADGRNKRAADELRAAGAHIVEIDVTNIESVDAGVTAALQALNGLDVLVNNAGVGMYGLQEAFSDEEIKRVFEVNVFGLNRVTRAVLPHMRQQGSGLLIHISSVLARITLPFYGPYNATKWAVEAFAENYRTELSPFGIESVMVEPGGFPTEFMQALVQPSDTDRIASYGEFAEAPAGFAAAFGEVLAQNPQQDPQLVADAVLKLVETPAGERPLRTPVDMLGLADALAPYNAQLEEITAGVYGNFGIADLLKTKVKAEA